MKAVCLLLILVIQFSPDLNGAPTQRIEISSNVNGKNESGKLTNVSAIGPKHVNQTTFSTSLKTKILTKATKSILLRVLDQRCGKNSTSIKQNGNPNSTNNSTTNGRISKTISSTTSSNFTTTTLNSVSSFNNFTNGAKPPQNSSPLNHTLSKRSGVNTISQSNTTVNSTNQTNLHDTSFESGTNNSCSANSISQNNNCTTLASPHYLTTDNGNTMSYVTTSLPNTTSSTRNNTAEHEMTTNSPLETNVTQSDTTNNISVIENGKIGMSNANTHHNTASIIVTSTGSTSNNTTTGKNVALGTSTTTKANLDGKNFTVDDSLRSNHSKDNRSASNDSTTTEATGNTENGTTTTVKPTVMMEKNHTATSVKPTGITVQNDTTSLKQSNTTGTITTTKSTSGNVNSGIITASPRPQINVTVPQVASPPTTKATIVGNGIVISNNTNNSATSSKANVSGGIILVKSIKLTARNMTAETTATTISGNATVANNSITPVNNVTAPGNANGSATIMGNGTTTVHDFTSGNGTSLNISSTETTSTKPTVVSDNLRGSRVNGQNLPVTTTMKLVQGSTVNEGRVEINFFGTWGTICDSGWGDNEASVVCKMLGYIKGVAVPNAFYGQGSGPILLHDIECSNTSTTIRDCTFSSVDNKNCTHVQDAGVICVKETIEAKK